MLVARCVIIKQQLTVIYCVIEEVFLLAGSAMSFERIEITSEKFDEVLNSWCHSDESLRVQLATELEWVNATQLDNQKYVVWSTDDENYPLISELTNVLNEYGKILKIKHAPYVVERFLPSMDFEYLTSLYKYLIESIIELTEAQGLNKFRVYLDNGNYIAVMAFVLFTQILLPQEYTAEFSKDQSWLFVEKSKTLP